MASSLTGCKNHCIGCFRQTLACFPCCRPSFSGKEDSYTSFQSAENGDQKERAESSLSKSEEAETTHSITKNLVCSAMPMPPGVTVAPHTHSTSVRSEDPARMGGTTTTLSSEENDRQPSDSYTYN